MVHKEWQHIDTTLHIVTLCRSAWFYLYYFLDIEMTWTCTHVLILAHVKTHKKNIWLFCCISLIYFSILFIFITKINICLVKLRCHSIKLFTTEWSCLKEFPIINYCNIYRNAINQIHPYLNVVFYFNLGPMNHTIAYKRNNYAFKFEITSFCERMWLLITEWEILLLHFY